MKPDGFKAKAEGIQPSTYREKNPVQDRNINFNAVYLLLFFLFCLKFST